MLSRMKYQTMANTELWGLLLGAYLLGSINSAVLICKITGKPDPRTGGSGNPGATNVLRIAGKPYAVFVLIFDILKGVIPVLTARYLEWDFQAMSLASLAAVLGHMFPIFLRFQGGKGVATAAGAIVALSPLVAAICLGVFALTVALSRMVSLGSILGALSAPIAIYLIDHRIEWAIIALALMITLKHHANIKRILKGQENRL